MKILVTGGAGFIGSHVVEQLLDLEHDVYVVFDIKKPGKIGHLMDKVTFVHGDIRNADDCMKAVRGMQAIIHLAALINVDHSIRSPRPFYDTNVMGTFNLLEAVHKTPQVEKFVYMSTAEVYGNIPKGCAKETDPCEPRSPYASSKYAAERYCLSYFHTYNHPEITVIRGFNTYGPRQSYGVRGAVIAIFILNALQNKPPTINGDGSQQRDYLYVKDLAEGIVKATLTEGLGGELINLAKGEPIRIRDLAVEVLERINPKLEPVLREARLGEVMRSCGDPAKAWKLLGWKWKTPFEKGLDETIDHYKKV